VTPNIPEAPATPVAKPSQLEAWSTRLAPIAPIAIPLLVFLVVVTIYRKTLMPTFGFWDTAEWQAVPYLLGIPHPTGYPTYVLLGKLFSFWPEGSIAWRANFFGAVSGAAAVAGLVVVARQLGAAWWSALVAGLGFAFSAAFWQVSSRADPHPLHVAFVMLTLGLAIAWYHTRRYSFLVALAVTTGLALGNQGQMVMFMPAFAALLFVAEKAIFTTPKKLLPLLAAGMAGLLVYAYIPLRAMQNPPINYAKPTNWERFKYLVTGEQFKGDMIFLSPAAVQNFAVNALKYPADMGQWFTPWGAIAVFGFGAAGLVTLWKKDWKLGLFLTLAWFVPFYQACNYINGDVRRYYFAATAMLVLFAAFGVQAFVKWVNDFSIARGLEKWGAEVAFALSVLAVFSCVNLARINWEGVDLSRDVTGPTVIYRVLGKIKPNAVISTHWLFSTSLWYVTFVEKFRTDIQVIDDRNILDEGYGDVPKTIDRFLGKRPVYILRHDDSEFALWKQSYEMVQLEDNVHPSGLGDLYEVIRKK
jgi:hypothetical protein